MASLFEKQEQAIRNNMLHKPITPAPAGSVAAAPPMTGLIMPIREIGGSTYANAKAAKKQRALKKGFLCQKTKKGKAQPKFIESHKRNACSAL